MTKRTVQNVTRLALDAKKVPLLTALIAMHPSFHSDTMALIFVIVSVASDGTKLILLPVIPAILLVWIVVQIVVAPCVTKTATCQFFSIASVFTNALQATRM
jgi:hypothetical protein